MLLVARKNLLNERTRLAISVGGVALSVFLIGILLSLYRGWERKVGEYVEVVPADLWVASDGTTDFAQSASILPQELGTEIGFHPDVQTVSPLIVRPMEVSREQDPPTDTFDLQLVGYAVIPVNAILRCVVGLSCWESLDGVPGPVEVVDVFRRSELALPVVDAAIRIGARAVWMQDGVIHAGAAARARAAGLLVVMDRCMMRDHAAGLGG